MAQMQPWFQTWKRFVNRIETVTGRKVAVINVDASEHINDQRLTYNEALTHDYPSDTEFVVSSSFPDGEWFTWCNQRLTVVIDHAGDVRQIGVCPTGAWEKLME